MKKIFFLLIILIVIPSFAQMHMQMQEKQRERIEQLKKIKLMEALSLSEEESIRFFSRYNDFHSKVKDFQLKKEKAIDEIQRLVQDGDKNFSDQKCDELLKKLISIEQQSDKLKSDFVKSLEDILPKFKIAKLIVFEREFARELNELIMSRRRMMRGKSFQE